MLDCFTIKDNLVSKGIPVKTDLINKVKYISPDGKPVDGYVKLYFNPEKSRVYRGELFNKVFKESEVDKGDTDGTLVSLNWESTIVGGSLHTDISDSISNGCLEVIATSRKFEGLSLDFKTELYTTTYLIKVNKECVVNYKSFVEREGKLRYSSKGSFKITFNPTREPKVVSIGYRL